ncbi:unnamed protein product [Arctia plantaginis]|uniref:C2H2-type domain-containing protein n=1 Tax=Arctia plantaginis TaxID=874455 RepID=A0A8S1BFM7_ARCPL|nr:unnamed protein product [Arctia plantaginis]
MLHNTGQYEPNETPMNMAAPVNMTPGSHMNIVSNINQLSKLGHGSTPEPSGPYGLGDYAVYHHQNFNMPSQIAQFPNHQYQHLGIPHNYSNHNPGSANEGSFQNGMLPMNLNIHNEHNAPMFSYEKSNESVRPDVIKDQNIKKVALNIPQIPNKVLPKQPLFENDYLHNDPFHNPNHNLDLSMKPNPERIEISSSRRKKIENTVKLIENILINSSNTKPKRLVQQSINDIPNQVDCSKNLSKSSTNAVRTESNVPKNDALSLTLVDSRQDSNPKRENVTKSPAINYDDVGKSEMDELSDVEDVKPINITLGIVPQNVLVTTEKCVEIKIENASWTDTDYAQPFFRDCHSFQREHAIDFRIIDSDSSVAEALTAIQNTEVKSDACYECPHCCVLFKNPKRFLIHTKWHTFGLTNEKRTELLREREEKRNQRKEAKIIERMNAKEITDTKKVEGKTWPCKDCDKIFSAKGSLKNHRQRSHPTRVRECRVCHKSVVGWLSLRNHMATHAVESGVGFQCSECPKRFKYSHSLAKHSDTHLEKVHGCAHCPKKFGSQALLKMHMKTHERHSRGATFRCTYCAKGFFESYSLQVHERTHRNERPFLCEICNTSYGTNSSLKRHLKVSHSTSKPFECSICHRSFSTEPIRDRHEERVHSKPEDFKFPCKQCDCKYLKLKDLKKHISKAHPKNKRRKRPKSETEPEEDSE